VPKENHRASIKQYQINHANITFNITFALMIKRKLESKIIEALKRSPSVALMGPRQVGKTTIAFNISESTPSVYLDLESRLDLQKVRDIVSFHNANQDKLIILDEVQRLPEVFSSLRGIIDQERRKGNKSGQFLFLGSASIELLKQSSESLAGRIAYLELYGINQLEYSNDRNTLWLRGGFPESLLALSDGDSVEWRRDFIKTYLERDIPQLGPRIPAETLERFWTMLAHYQGSVLNPASLARSLDVTGVTIGRYLDLMVDLLLVRRLKPWTYNVGKRLVRSPKIYVRDSGITHALLNITDYNELLRHPVVGGSWEGFVVENILSVAPAGVQPFYYGTPAGAEIDLILEFSAKEKWAIEIKRNSSPSLNKGFHIACNDINPERRYVVYSGTDQFSLGNGVTAISLPDLMLEILKI
jgi:predicted AAA+ superfamily ATPase